MSKKRIPPLPPAAAAKVAFNLIHGKKMRVDHLSFASSMAALGGHEYDNNLPSIAAFTSAMQFSVGKQVFEAYGYISKHWAMFSLIGLPDGYGRCVEVRVNPPQMPVPSETHNRPCKSSELEKPNPYNRKFVAKLRALIALHGLNLTAGKAKDSNTASGIITLSSRSPRQPYQHTIAIATKRL